jgi:hypothetical protein
MNRIARLPFAVVCGLAIAGCLSLGLGVIAIAGELPYRPERYAARFDPMRAGLAGMFAAAVLVFALSPWPRSRHGVRAPAAERHLWRSRGSVSRSRAPRFWP